LNQKLKKLLEGASERVREMLEENVLNAKEQEASEINNEGVHAQVKYLIESGTSEEEIIGLIEQTNEWTGS